MTAPLRNNCLLLWTKCVIRNNPYCLMDRLRSLLHHSMTTLYRRSQESGRISRTSIWIFPLTYLSWIQARMITISLSSIMCQENYQICLQCYLYSGSHTNMDLETMCPRTLTDNHTNIKSIVGIWRISATDEEGISQTFD